MKITILGGRVLNFLEMSAYNIQTLIPYYVRHRISIKTILIITTKLYEYIEKYEFFKFVNIGEYFICFYLQSE